MPWPERGLGPEDIDTVVNTHPHPDHCGNNHLFTKARSADAHGRRDNSPRVLAMATPGHTLDSISVVMSLGQTAMR